MEKGERYREKTKNTSERDEGTFREWRYCGIEGTVFTV